MVKRLIYDCFYIFSEENIWIFEHFKMLKISLSISSFLLALRGMYLEFSWKFVTHNPDFLRLFRNWNILLDKHNIGFRHMFCRKSFCRIKKKLKVRGSKKSIAVYPYFYTPDCYMFSWILLPYNIAFTKRLKIRREIRSGIFCWHIHDILPWGSCLQKNPLSKNVGQEIWNA